MRTAPPAQLSRIVSDHSLKTADTGAKPVSAWSARVIAADGAFLDYLMLGTSPANEAARDDGYEG